MSPGLLPAILKNISRISTETIRINILNVGACLVICTEGVHTTGRQGGREDAESAFVAAGGQDEYDD